MSSGWKGLAAGALVLGLCGTAAAQPAAGDHDGAWQFVLTCSPNSATRAAGFTERFPATITNGQFSRARTIRMAEGPEIVERWQGVVREGRMEVVVEHARGPQRWITRLAGTAVSPARFDLTGGVNLADNRQVRSCTMSAALQRPAAQSLAARGALAEQEGLGRLAAAAQQRLAAVETALAAAMMAAGRAEERGDALQTELDLARFEGNAVREEADRRGAALAAAAQMLVQAQQQGAALAARATQAEGALAQLRTEAEGREHQLEVALRACATQAEGALRALRTEAEGRLREIETALAARATQAEGALGQIRAEAEARLRQAETAQTALAARATQAEGALSQIRAEAEQARRALAERETLLGQIRAELEQARRSLAEREAAAPRQ